MENSTQDTLLYELEERVRLSAIEASADSKFNAVEAALERAEAVGKIEPLTVQQRQMIAYVRSGITPQHAARAVGMSLSEAAAFVRDNTAARSAMEYLVAVYTADIQVNINVLTAQAYEERARASTAAEGLRALEFIAKLHGIGGYAADAKKSKGGSVVDSVTASEGGENGVEDLAGARKKGNRKRLEMLGDDALLEGADLGIDSLEPQPVVREKKGA